VLVAWASSAVTGVSRRCDMGNGPGRDGARPGPFLSVFYDFVHSDLAKTARFAGRSAMRRMR
jgi:hypothetical protein